MLWIEYVGRGGGRGVLAPDGYGWAEEEGGSGRASGAGGSRGAQGVQGKDGGGSCCIVYVLDYSAMRPDE